VRDLGASLIVPRYSRYVIDLNRPPDDAPMYPDANSTGLCPERFFSGEPLYRPGLQPDAAEVARRREANWQPYHDALQRELLRLKSAHGYALLLDGHSIKSELPWLFCGRLPDLNLGTADGRELRAFAANGNVAVAAGPARFHPRGRRPLQGRLHCSTLRPTDRGVHAAQLEMCWSCYMPETPPYQSIRSDPAPGTDPARTCSNPA